MLETALRTNKACEQEGVAEFKILNDHFSITKLPYLTASTAGIGKLRNKKVHNFHPSSNNVRVIKIEDNMRGVRESRTQNTRNAFDIPAEHIDEKAYVGKSGIFTIRFRKLTKVSLQKSRSVHEGQ